VAAAVVLGPGGDRLFSGVIPPDRIVVIPNGLPDDAPEGEGAVPVDDEVGGSRLLFLSTLMRGKGFLDVLSAMPAVLRLVPNARLTLAGDWFSDRDREEALRFLVDADLEQSVVLLGPVGPREKRALLSQSDVFVMPPRHIEGMPYVLLEAMRAGLPVVSTPVGFIPSMVDDGRTGLLVRPGDPEALSQALVALLQDRPLREALGQAGREKFLNEFTFERWAEAMNRLLLGETACPQPPAK
jgi:glycosyltransferase involved in cell wall biosynthesis